MWPFKVATDEFPFFPFLAAELRSRIWHLAAHCVPRVHRVQIDTHTLEPLASEYLAPSTADMRALLATNREARYEVFRALPSLTTLPVLSRKQTAIYGDDDRYLVEERIVRGVIPFRPDEDILSICWCTSEQIETVGLMSYIVEGEIDRQLAIESAQRIEPEDWVFAALRHRDVWRRHREGERWWMRQVRHLGVEIPFWDESWFDNGSDEDCTEKAVTTTSWARFTAAFPNLDKFSLVVIPTDTVTGLLKPQWWTTQNLRMDSGIVQDEDWDMIGSTEQSSPEEPLLEGWLRVPFPGHEVGLPSDFVGKPQHYPDIFERRTGIWIEGLARELNELRRLWDLGVPRSGYRGEPNLCLLKLKYDILIQEPKEQEIDRSVSVRVEDRLWGDGALGTNLG